MKTLKFFAVILFVCFAAAQTQAQKKGEEPDWNNAGTKTYAFELNTWGNVTIICDGDFTDYLVGEDFTVKIRAHFKDGKFVRYNLMNNGNVWTSQVTGEKFTVHELDKGDAGDLVWYRFNVIGNMGSHYIGKGVSKWNEEKQDWDIIGLTVNCL